MSASADFIARETATRRQPLETYHIWRGSSHWRYVSGDLPISEGGYTWTPATIQRGSVILNSDMKSSEVSVTFVKTDPAVAAYIATTPMELAWIEIRRLLRDQDPPESQLKFKGEIISVAVRGLSAQARCAGMEHLLQRQMLQLYDQPGCNHTVFDSRCQLSPAAFTTTASVSVDASGCVLTAAAFALHSDQYYRLGRVQYAGDYRMITGHVGAEITIQYAFAGLSSGATVSVVPGCDGDVDTCRDKFGNLDHFLAAPFIPLDNPATWVGR